MNHSKTIKPRWISHRGLKGNAVENTLEAFTQAVAAGFTVLETDLRLSKDKHLVLMHDRRLERLTNDDRYINELSRRELEKIHFMVGGKILFLDEFVSAFHECDWVFDIKPEQGQQVIEALVALLERAGPSDVEKKMKFCTWKRAHEQRLRQYFPRAAYYARQFECWRAGIATLLGIPNCGGIKAERTYSVPSQIGPISLFRERYVQRYHRLGGQAIAYLPRTKDEAQAAVRAGFDEILTDDRIVTV